MTHRQEKTARRALARRALKAALTRAASAGERIDVGDVELQGSGLSRDGFAAHVEFVPDPRGLSNTYFVLLATDDADAQYPERVRREARVLEWVEPRLRGVRAPRVLALLDHEDPPILVVGMVAGLPVELRSERTPIEPWQVVADVAAAVHAVEPPPGHVLPARDRRQHRAELVRELCDGLAAAPAVIADACAWMREQVDRPGPGVLLHGDLLGHNLRLNYWHDTGLELGVIDWEYAALGDPAHDLAIVTRGARNPFQHSGGRARLLAAYEARAGVEVTRADLRFFELALRLRWFRDATDRPQESLAILGRLLRGA